jgi:hypothetical protein
VHSCSIADIGVGGVVEALVGDLDRERLMLLQRVG